MEPLALKRNPGSRKEGVPPHREIQICRIRSCEAELADLRQDWEAFDKLCDALEDLREVRIRLSQESSWSRIPEDDLRRNLHHAADPFPQIRVRAGRGLSFVFIVAEERYLWGPWVEIFA